MKKNNLKLLGALLLTTGLFNNVSAQVPKDGTDNDPDYVDQFRKLLKERDRAIFDAKKDSVKRQEVLQKRLESVEKEIAEQKGYLKSMLDNTELVPAIGHVEYSWGTSHTVHTFYWNSSREMFDKETARLYERLGAAGRAFFTGTRDLGNETAARIEAAELKLVQEMHRLNGSPEVETSQAKKLEYRLPGQ